MVIAVDTSNWVPEDEACPVCKERDADLLVWDESGEWVHCQRCGAVYKPGGDHDEA